MKLVLQIAGGVLLGLLIYEAIFRYQVQRDLDEGLRAIERAGADPDPWGLRRKVSQNQAAEQQRQLARQAALQLKPNEECLGWVAGASGRAGTVVVRGADGHTVSQLIENGRPVECVYHQRLK